MPFPHVSWKPAPIAALVLFLLASLLILQPYGNISTLLGEDRDEVSGIEKAYVDSLKERDLPSQNTSAIPGGTHDKLSDVSEKDSKTEPKDSATAQRVDGEEQTTKPESMSEREVNKKHDQQAHESFISSLLMILVSEMGDKTFLIAALMAMTHPRWVIFSAAFSALVVMSVLSAALGHVVPNLIPKFYTNYLAAFLFFAFGARMLKEGMGMDADEINHEMEEVQTELAEKEGESKTVEMEEGRDRGVASTEGGSVLRWLFSSTWITAFVLTFLAEWGDRSQIATIALAAARNVYWVTIGTILGHCACTSLAVVGGRLLASRISVRTVTLTGAVLFLLFSMAYSYQSISAYLNCTNGSSSQPC